MLHISHPYLVSLSFYTIPRRVFNLLVIFMNNFAFTDYGHSDLHGYVVKGLTMNC